MGDGSDDEEASVERLITKKLIKCFETSQKCLDLSSLDGSLDQIPEHILAQFSEDKLSQITQFILDFNDFVALPSNTSLLKGLTSFSAEGNEILSLPESFCELVLLQEIRLNENKIYELPEAFSQLCNLRVLSLIGNQLSILHREAVQGLVQIEEIYLDENRLSALPENIGELRKLKILELSENMLTFLPESFGELKELQVLNLSRNKLSDLPSTFGSLSQLRNVDLSENSLSSLPEEFCSASVIEKLCLDNNIIGFLPGWFGSLSNITYLSLNDNKLQNAPLPESFPKTSKATLTSFEAGGNAMTTLPESFGELTKLEKLHLGSTICELERRNFQNGNWIAKLPETFGNLKAMRKLHLDENQIKSLPDSFGNLSNLTWLDLGQNLLSTIPESFGDLEMLEYCQLSKNELISLPESIGKLQKLTDLRLDNNRLEKLPGSFAKLQALHTLDLFNNLLTEIPTWLPKLSMLKRLDLDANKLNLKLKDVPHIVAEASHYAPRDPKFKDNWRGKTRPDKIPAEVEVIVGDKDDGDDGDDDENITSGYNENLLFAAMRRGLSIWRSHTGPSERQVDNNTEDLDLSRLTFSVFEDDEYDGDNDVINDEGFYVKVSHKEKEMADTEEDWDQEIINSHKAMSTTTTNNNKPLKFRIGVEVSDDDVEKRDDFLSLLSSYPPASQAFTPTANYNSHLLCTAYDRRKQFVYNIQQAVFTQGQFDDADENF